MTLDNVLVVWALITLVVGVVTGCVGYLLGQADGLRQHDCFWDPRTVRGKRITNIADLRMDVTDEEADAFLAAIEEQSADGLREEER